MTIQSVPAPVQGINQDGPYANVAQLNRGCTDASTIPSPVLLLPENQFPQPRLAELNGALPDPAYLCSGSGCHPQIAEFLLSQNITDVVKIADAGITITAMPEGISLTTPAVANLWLCFSPTPTGVPTLAEKLEGTAPSGMVPALTITDLTTPNLAQHLEDFLAGNYSASATSLAAELAPPKQIEVSSQALYAVEGVLLFEADITIDSGDLSEYFDGTYSCIFFTGRHPSEVTNAVTITVF